MKAIVLKNWSIGGDGPFALIAGPCVIETEDMTRRIAEFLKEATSRLGISLAFKASYDKANRTSKDSFRGPGMEKGLRILENVKREFDLPVLSDVHRFEEIAPAAEILDIVQVPAFLCRQTDFVAEIARRAKVVNIKKGQFLSPWDMRNVLEKAVSAGNDRVLVTERGASFGYNNLVADFRSLPILRQYGCPVVFDATHSVQLPGGQGSSSGGQRDMVPYLARAATAVGVDGLFFEVHPEPEQALCDGPNSLRLEDFPRLLAELQKIDRIVKDREAKSG